MVNTAIGITHNAITLFSYRYHGNGITVIEWNFPRRNDKLADLAWDRGRIGQAKREWYFGSRHFIQAS